MYIVVYIIGVKFFSKREGYYSTITVFGLSCYIYYIGIPFELSLLGLQEFRWGIILTPSQLNQIIAMGISAFVAFSVGYYISKFNPFKNSNQSLKISFKQSVPYSIFFLWILSIVITPTIFYEKILSMKTYSEAYGIIYRNPELSLLTDYVILCTALISATFLAKTQNIYKLIGIGLVVMIVLWSIYSSDKNPLLIGLLALGAYYAGFKGKRFITFLLIIFGGALILFLFTMFNIYQGGGDISPAYIFTSRYGIIYSDPAGPILSLAYVLDRPIDFKYGTTYLDFFNIIIPKALWSERPLDLAEQFARETIVNWAEGQGMGYSLLAEAYLNFSWIGPFIQYFLLGLMWGYFWKKLCYILWYLPKSLWQNLYLILGYYFLILMHRGPVSSLLKSMVQYVLAIVLFAVVFDLSMIKYKKSYKKHSME